MNGNDYSIIKAANRTLILNTIAEFGPISVVDIMRKINLSRPTVEKLVQKLLHEGMIEKSGTARQSVSVGRSAQLYDVGSDRYFSIGIDFEVPKIRLTVINLRMQTVYYTSWECDENKAVSKVISRLVSEIRLAINAICVHGKSDWQVIGIGIGICGQLDLLNKVSLHVERIDGWRNIRLAEILEREFDVPVSMRNDVHMLAMVKKEERLRANVRNYIYVSLRSGIGMALFINGELFTGTLGNAGFLGHTTVNYLGAPCRCGNFGCLETYLRPERLAAEYASLTQNNISYEGLYEKFVQLDSTAVAVMQEAFIVLGKAVANVIKTIDIHNIVFNGLPDDHRGLILSWISEGIRATTIDVIYKNIHVEDESMPSEDAAKGGAMLMIREFFADPKLFLSPEIPALL